MSPSNKALPPATDLHGTDAELVAEFSKLVRDVSAEIAREAVVPNLKQALVGVSEVNSRTIGQVEEKVRALLDDDRQLLQETLQGPVREIVAAYEGAQQTLATLASSSRLLENLQLLTTRLEELRQAADELERQRQERERLLKEETDALQETIRALEQRIPDAARVLNEVSENREALRGVTEETGLLAAQARQLLTQLEDHAREIQRASETISSTQEQLAALHEQVHTLQEQADKNATSLSETLAKGFAGAEQQAEKRWTGLLSRVDQAVKASEAMAPAMMQSLQETSESLAGHVEERLTAQSHQWTATLRPIQDQLQALQETTDQIRQQISRYRAVLWLLVLLTVLMAVRPVW